MEADIENNIWDSFEDNLTYSDEGIAQLGRWYKKDKNYISKHIKETKDDKNVTPIPIVAYGITAFLSDNNIISFRCSLNPYKGINHGVGVKKFFSEYFNKRFSSISQRNRESTPFEDERKSNIELIKEHLDDEQQLLLKSELFFSQVADNEKQIVETIKKASLKYQEWLKKKLPDLDKTIDIQKGAIPESKDEKLKHFEATINDKEPVDNVQNLVTDQEKDIKPKKQIENPEQENKFDFDKLLQKIKYDKDAKTKNDVKNYLIRLSEYERFKQANKKEFTAVALIFYKTGWVINTKTFNEWSVLFAEAFKRKKTSYKPNQIASQIEDMKTSIPFLDNLPPKQEK